MSILNYLDIISEENISKVIPVLKEISQEDISLLEDENNFINFFDCILNRWEKEKNSKNASHLAENLFNVLSILSSNKNLHIFLTEEFVIDLINASRINAISADSSTKAVSLALELLPMSNSILDIGLEIVGDTQYFSEDFLTNPALKCKNIDRRNTLKALELFCSYFISEYHINKIEAEQYFKNDLTRDRRFLELTNNHFKNALSIIISNEYLKSNWLFPNENLWIN